MVGTPNNVNVQAAIAANSVKESYDSISNLIDTNLKKLDADVFTAHDNFAGNDLKAILNSEKFAADIRTKAAASSAFQIVENNISNANSSSADSHSALPEFNEPRGHESFYHSGDTSNEGAHNSSAAPQANNNVSHISHGGFNHLAENNTYNSTYNKGGSDTKTAEAHDGKDGTDGKDGKDGNDGNDGHCGCGDGGHHCGKENEPQHHHHGHHDNPLPPVHEPCDDDHHKHHEHKGHEHHHEPQPPIHHNPHQPPEHCEPHNPPHLTLPHLHIPNLLNVDVLGNLGGALLHGHLGNPHNPLINLVAGGNLLGGLNNNSSGHGTLLDVVTNTNLLNPGKNSPLETGIDIGVLRGEHNNPLLEIGLSGDVLHNAEDLLNVNLNTEHWGKNGPQLGVNIINIKDLPKDKLAQVVEKITEKAFNDATEVKDGIKSLAEEVEEGVQHTTQPITQVGLALATLGATVLAAPAVLGGVANAANGDLSQFTNQLHQGLGNLSHINMGSDPLHIGSIQSHLPNIDGVISTLHNDGGAIVGSLNGNAGNITGTLAGDLGNIGGAAGHDAGAVIGALPGEVGSVTGALGSDIGSVDSNVSHDVGSIVGTVGSDLGNIGSSVQSYAGGLGGELNNVGTALHTDIGNITGAVSSDLSGIGGALTHDVGSVLGTVSGDLGSIGSGVGSTLSNVGGSLGSDLSHIGNGVGSTLSSIDGTLGSTLSNIGSGVGSTLGGTLGNVGDSLSHNLGGVSGAVSTDLGNIGGSIVTNAGNVLGSVQSTATGITSTVSGITDLAGVHLGSGGSDISLPVLSGGSSGLPEISLSGSGLTVGGASSIDLHSSLSNLDPLSPFADHAGVSGSAGAGLTSSSASADSVLSHVTTITHDVVTSTDHHVTNLLHGHG